MSVFLPPGIVKACAGIVQAEGVIAQSYIDAIQQASQFIGQNYSPEAEKERAELVTAVKLNLANQKDYPYELLQRRYLLPLGKNAFTMEKHVFCFELAKSLKMI